MSLRRFRERKFMNQSQLAEALGVRQKTVSDWERGTARPRPAHMKNLCDVLGVTPDELLAALEPGRHHTPSLYPEIRDAQVALNRIRVAQETAEALSPMRE